MRLTFFAFIIAVATVYFHNIGLHGWYIQYWWYDIFMHILGGLAIGLLWISIATLFDITIKRKWLIVLFTLIVGLAWEYFEIHFNLTGYPVGTKLYYEDTALDILDDIIGGFLAVCIYIRSKK